MPSVNAFWGVCDESALTTCWSSMRSSCIVSYVPTLSISTRHDHIKASTSRFRKGKSPLFHEISVVIESFRFRSWVGYTTRTEEWPERYNVTVAIPEEGAFRVPPRYSLSCLKETFSLRPLVTGKPGYSVQNWGVNSHTKTLVAACLILKEQRKEIGRAIIFPLF